MSTTMTNGKPARKQLGDQIDRLDAILDVMANGLPAAVTDAVREGTRFALKDALIELLTNAEVRALLAPPVPPVPAASSAAPAPASEPKTPGVWARFKAQLAAVRDSLTGTATKAKEAAEAKYKAASDVVAAVGAAAGEALPLRRVLWVGLGAGLLVGVVCMFVPHAAAAAVSAVSVAVTAVAAQTAKWLRKAASQLRLI